MIEDRADEPVLTVDFRLGFIDVYSMYVDTWPGRGAAAFGLLFAFVAVVPPFQPDRLAAGLAAVAFAVSFVPVYAAFIAGATGFIGSTIRLVINETGVLGWPMSADVDRTWDSLKSARVIGTVVLLPFPSPFGTRTMWVGIPLRALTNAQHKALLGRLKDRGLMKARGRRRLPRLGRY